MAFTFSQSTGRIFRGSWAEADKWEAFGYAGHSDRPWPLPLSMANDPVPPTEGRNRPSMQTVPKVGPLPRGRYKIGPAYNHPKLGPITMNLTPQQGNQMYGRSEFRIHGDSIHSPGTASEGCLCLPPAARSYIARNVAGTFKQREDSDDPPVQDDDLDVIE